MYDFTDEVISIDRFIFTTNKCFTRFELETLRDTHYKVSLTAQVAGMP